MNNFLTYMVFDEIIGKKKTKIVCVYIHNISICISLCKCVCMCMSRTNKIAHNVH